MVGRWSKQVVVAESAPRAIGPYSQAVRVGPWLFVSGQIALDPRSGEMVTGGFEAELRQVLENLGAILRAAEMDYRDVVQVTVFLRDLSHYAKLNEIYAQYFQSEFPARCAVQVARLPRDASVEIAVVAYRARR
ncbi:MAG: RidA family protein [candidate division KSB1 bacterium]|nr:RidA family protein [candidate division KSB1 bacterium]